jgi:hypothetical protein
MALLVDAGWLIAAIEPQDLAGDLGDDTPACFVGSLAGRTVAQDALLFAVRESMRRARRRRLAATAADGRLLGLLCLKANGLGFCSDDDVTSRRRSRERHEGQEPVRFICGLADEAH